MSKKTIVEIIEGEMLTGSVDATKAFKSELAFPIPEPKVEAYQHHGGGHHHPSHHGGGGGLGLIGGLIMAGAVINAVSMINVRCPNCSTILRVSSGCSGIVNCCSCNCNFQI